MALSLVSALSQISDVQTQLLRTEKEVTEATQLPSDLSRIVAQFLVDEYSVYSLFGTEEEMKVLKEACQKFAERYEHRPIIRSIGGRQAFVTARSYSDSYYYEEWQCRVTIHVPNKPHPILVKVSVLLDPDHDGIDCKPRIHMKVIDKDDEARGPYDLFGPGGEISWVSSGNVATLARALNCPPGEMAVLCATLPLSLLNCTTYAYMEVLLELDLDSHRDIADRVFISPEEYKTKASQRAAGHEDDKQPDCPSDCQPSAPPLDTVDCSDNADTTHAPAPSKPECTADSPSSSDRTVSRDAGAVDGQSNDDDDDAPLVPNQQNPC